MRALRLAMLMAGTMVALALVPSATAEYSDPYCWDSGSGRGCEFARENGWYGCSFAGAYSSKFIAGAAVCGDRIEIQHQE